MIKLNKLEYCGTVHALHGSDSMPTLSKNHFVGNQYASFCVVAMDDNYIVPLDKNILAYLDHVSDRTNMFWLMDDQP